MPKVPKINEFYLF